jgi:hypothetical protein
VISISRIHGKRGRFYIGIASGGTPEPLPFIARWAIRFPTDKAEVTAMGDTHKTYVNGMPDCTGMVSGFLDDATAQTYTAATDSLARSFYLYPDLSSNTKYWYGTCVIDFTAEGGVDGGVTLNADWGAASTVTRVGN